MAAIDAIVASAGRVRGLVDQVSAASREQSAGIGQVGDTVVQMEKVTQSTAAAAEESATASEELSTQADVVMEVVSELATLTEPPAPTTAQATDTPASALLF